jgi:hypothetical protein
MDFLFKLEIEIDISFIKDMYVYTKYLWIIPSKIQEKEAVFGC